LIVIAVLDQRSALSEYRLREAIQSYFENPDCFVTNAPRNDEATPL